LNAPGGADVPGGHRLHAHRGVAPRVLADVDQHAHEPGFFAGGAGRHAVRPAGGAQERFLHHVGRVVRVPHEPPREPEEALVMGVEERGDPRFRIVV
jgi:hypothetical protein